ncbi:MAG: hypothetical protein U1E65_17620 [Myxococcota bacterium]
MSGGGECDGRWVAGTVLLCSAGRHHDALWAPMARRFQALGAVLEHLPIDKTVSLDPERLRTADLVCFALEPEQLEASSESAVAAHLYELWSTAVEVSPRLALWAPSGSHAAPELMALVDRVRPGCFAAEEEAIADRLEAALGPPGAYSTTLFLGPESGEPETLERMGLAHRIQRDDGRPLFVLNVDALTAPSITEGFRILPVAPGPRAALEELLDRAAADLLGRAVIQSAAEPLTRPVPEADRPRKTGWMELLPFEDGADPGSGQRLLELIALGRLDTLWVSISPNQYYRPQARFFAKTEIMERALVRLLEGLAAQAYAARRAPPRVLVAIHPANNVPRPAEVARDLYRTDYPDIPAPLWRPFWEAEVLEPCAHFAARWQKEAWPLPLGGFVLDLELYLRTATGVSEFRSTMGFEDATLRASPARALDGPGLSQHFGWLESEAERLARELRLGLLSAAPGGMIAAYAPSLSLDWFYRGFYRGLGERLPLYTFSASLGDQPAQVGLSVSHSAVLMLSKLRRLQDSAWFSEILSKNQGIWLNRISRVETYQPTAWHRLEQSPLSFPERARIFEVLGNL